LEKNGLGLNLTWEVRDGILNHSKGEKSMFGHDWGLSNSYEAEVVKISDAIAYINHDIGDAVRAGILSEKDLPRESSELLGDSHSKRVNTMVTDIVENSWAVSGQDGNQRRPEIAMSAEIGQATDRLRNFMFERVYNVLSANAVARNARDVVRGLYEYLVKHEEILPVEYLSYSDETQRRVVDYIAGMTDRYALDLARELGVPS
jgi:dGTPase